MTIGYDKPLYILPFDHRSSFGKGLFGWSGPLSPDQVARVAESKAVIYDAFKEAIGSGAVPREHAGILVDPQFGAAILKDARASGFTTCMPVEKSGKEEFEFEDGEQYKAKIEEFQPTFVKVLVRYNPEGDAAMNARQAGRLRELSDYLHAHGRFFMFELLVPMTHEQSDRLEGSTEVYDHDLRPSLMIATIKELQNAGVEPDVWKVEGLDRSGDCAAIVAAARRDGRDHVGCIILGRGSNSDKVLAWLGAAAPVKGFIGFAVGRTSFWDALVGWRDKTKTRAQAVTEIAGRYAEWTAAFRKGAASAG